MSNIHKRGFASVTPERRSALAHLGGIAAHVKGTAHEWTAEEARVAGRKGGLASVARRRRQDRGEAAAKTVGAAVAQERPPDDG
jgi:general stress protein YciG